VAWRLFAFVEEPKPEVILSLKLPAPNSKLDHTVNLRCYREVSLHMSFFRALNSRLMRFKFILKIRIIGSYLLLSGIWTAKLTVLKIFLAPSNVPTRYQK
jgi:hypothetical protein